jgi:hypothetical protein
MIHAFRVDVTAIGLDEMREYPELGTSLQLLRTIADTKCLLVVCSHIVPYEGLG